MDWITAPEPVDYLDAITWMEDRVAAIRAGTADECVWLLEHPPLYTAGTSAKADDLINAQFPVHQTGRGGQYTYHGPGQRVAYMMLDLHKRGGDIRHYVWQLEEWIIRTLADVGVTGERRDGRIGIWVHTSHRHPGQGAAAIRDLSTWRDPGLRRDDGVIENLRSSSEAIAQEKGPQAAQRAVGQENKIAAIGVRVTRGVTWHGVSLNVNPDLSHYAGIVPCGLADFGVTSLHELGVDKTMADIDILLEKNFKLVF